VTAPQIRASVQTQSVCRSVQPDHSQSVQPGGQSDQRAAAVNTRSCCCRCRCCCCCCCALLQYLQYSGGTFGCFVNRGSLWRAMSRRQARCLKHYYPRVDAIQVEATSWLRFFFCLIPSNSSRVKINFPSPPRFYSPPSPGATGPPSVSCQDLANAE